MTASLVHRAGVSVVIAAALLVAPVGCGGSTGNDRWVTTENTNVEIDWDAVGKAYREAEGPEDFEKRVNEIYEGDEIISVSVVDKDAATQVVTGFFDKDEDGKVGEGEEIFTLQRDVSGADSAKYQIQGHGPYASYHSPVWDIVAGMAIGSMISRAFSPGYSPMYTQPYTTSPARRGDLATHRSSYRQANPERFAKSKSGRTYGSKGGAFGGGRPAPRPTPRGGGRFGRRAAPARSVRLSA